MKNQKKLNAKMGLEKVGLKIFKLTFTLGLSDIRW